MSFALFKWILFTALFINFSILIVATAITDVNGDPVFTLQDMARLPNYKSNAADVAIDVSAEQINPAGVTEDKGNLVFRLLDLITLGVFSKFVTILDTYAWTWINVLDSLFGRWMEPAVQTMIFPTLKTLALVIYGLGMFELLTNKTIF